MKGITRRFLSIFLNFSKKIESRFDKDYLLPDVPMADKIAHRKWKKFLIQNFNKPGIRILELGSRNVTSAANGRDSFAKATYVGFDYYEGENVDVVGDAHRLSTYFKEDENFDLIYSSACFEHFAMPWIVATEVANLLKVGGHLFVETHFAFSSHERPWHFFHYNDMALKVLFSPALGFECIETGMSTPIVGRFSKYAHPYLQMKPVVGLYCHVEYYGKKVKEVENFDWNTVKLQEVVGKTAYPEPNK